MAVVLAIEYCFDCMIVVGAEIPSTPIESYAYCYCAEKCLIPPIFYSDSMLVRQTYPKWELGHCYHRQRDDFHGYCIFPGMVEWMEHTTRQCCIGPGFDSAPSSYYYYYSYRDDCCSDDDNADSNSYCQYYVDVIVLTIEWVVMSTWNCLKMVVTMVYSTWRSSNVWNLRIDS